MSLCIDDCLVFTPNGHLCIVTFTRCSIDTINSPDDGHMAARNMSRIEINLHEKELCVKLVIYRDSPHNTLTARYNFLSAIRSRWRMLAL